MEKKKKTIYISDLDGTLLNPQAEMSEKAVQMLNELIEKGLHFTAATARTWATVEKIMEGVHLSEPVILMNGVCLYHPLQRRYVKVECIPQEAVHQMISAMKQAQVQGFMYQIIDDKLHTYYEKLDTPWLLQFYEERRKKYDKKFIQLDSLYDMAGDHVIYFSVFNNREKLDPVYEQIKNVDGLHIEYYRDIYSKELWYLEVSAGTASKAAAVTWLKEYGQYDHLVVFGDNYNDLSMFQAADQKIAVQNAVPDVLKAADLVIGPNTEEGVPQYLRERELHGNL